MEASFLFFFRSGDITCEFGQISYIVNGFKFIFTVSRSRFCFNAMLLFMYNHTEYTIKLKGLITWLFQIINGNLVLSVHLPLNKRNNVISSDLMDLSVISCGRHEQTTGPNSPNNPMLKKSTFWLNQSCMVFLFIIYYYLFITHKIVARRPNCIAVYNIKTSNIYKWDKNNIQIKQQNTSILHVT